MTIHTLPVGAGNCQLLQCPAQNKLIVFDCGSRGVGNLGWDEDAVKQYVEDLIDPFTEIVVSVSHADADHSNYLPVIFKSTEIADIVLAQQRIDYPTDVRKWIDARETRGANVISWETEHSDLAPNDELSCWRPDKHGGWDIDVAAYILAVNAGKKASDVVGPTANDMSMVVSETYGAFQTIFTGDMTGKTEDVILANLQIDLADTDVITGAHHGSDTFKSNSDSWVDANEAGLVMFSSGTRDGHPQCVAVDRYLPFLDDPSDEHEYWCGVGKVFSKRKTEEPVLVTNNQGLIKVLTDGVGYEYEWDPGDRRGRGDATKNHRP